MSGEGEYSFFDLFELSWYETQLEKRAQYWDDVDMLQAESLLSFVNITIRVTALYILKNSLISKALLRKHSTQSTPQTPSERPASDYNDNSHEKATRFHLRSTFKEIFSNEGTGDGGDNPTYDDLIPEEFHGILKAMGFGYAKFVTDYNDIDVMSSLKNHNGYISHAQFSTLLQVVCQGLQDLLTRRNEIVDAFISCVEPTAASSPDTTAVDNILEQVSRGSKPRDQRLQADTETRAECFSNYMIYENVFNDHSTESFSLTSPDYEKVFATRSLNRPPKISDTTSPIPLAKFKQHMAIFLFCVLAIQVYIVSLP